MDDFVGAAAGDWNLDGRMDLVAAAIGKIAVIDPAGGTIEDEIATASITRRGAEFFGLPLPHPGETVLWTELEEGRSAILHYPKGWPRTLPVVGADGRVVWSFLSEYGINSAEWVDIDGDGRTEAGIAQGGPRVLTLLDHDGRARWSVEEPGVAWIVQGLSARDRRPGLVLCSYSGGGIRVYDAAGKYLRSLAAGEDIITFGAAEVDREGRRQVLAASKAAAGSLDFAFAMDVEGKVLWKFPIDEDALDSIRASDLTGDGVSEWILAFPRAGVVLVLDVEGGLVAILRGTGEWKTCTAVPAERVAVGRVCLSGRNELVAYVLTRM